MITNKDIRVENGSLIINGDPYPLDGQSPETIMEIVEDNSDTTPTENSDAPITSGGVFTALAGVETKINEKISFYTMSDQSVSVTGPYTDIQLTKPVVSGYTFYLISAFAYNARGWNLSNISADAALIRVYSTENTAVTSNLKTQWLKVKND